MTDIIVKDIKNGSEYYYGWSAEVSAEDVSYDNTTSGMTADNVQDAMDEVFQSVSNGKTLIAAAITDKGVSTAASDSFQTMATNIGLIQTWGNADHIINNNTWYWVVLKTKELANNSSFNNIQLNFNDWNLYLFWWQRSSSSNYELNFAVVFIKEDFTVQTLDCSFLSYSWFPNQQIYAFTKNWEDNTMYVWWSWRYSSGMWWYSTWRMSMLKYNTTTKERTTDSQVFWDWTYTVYSTLPDPIIDISYNVQQYTWTNYFVKQFVVFNS